jgi:hypothetical protein
LTQAQRVRDSRGAPEFVFNPRLGETYPEALDVKGNPSIDMDWYEAKFKATNEPYRYTVAHWCATEARFRNHLKKVKLEDAAKLISLENMLVRIHAAGRRLPAVPGEGSPARTCPTSASTSRCREPTARSSSARCRGSSSSSASSAARRGACCRARRDREPRVQGAARDPR